MMAQTLDLIRSSQLPSNLMQSAARGALAVPSGETIEILVYLALHHKLFGDQARLTLAGWDEKASLDAAGDPNTSAEVLGYFALLENLRPSLLPVLAENPSVTEESLDELAVSGSRSILESLMMSSRVMGSPRLLEALQSNPSLRPNELTEIGKQLAVLKASTVTESAEADAPDEVVESTVTKYLEENAAELAAEEEQPFQPIGMAYEDAEAETAEVKTTEAGPEIATVPANADADATNSGVAKSTAATPRTPAATAAIKARKPSVPAHVERRDSTLQKISKLDIRGRISLAMRGSKEDRSILVRDSTKLVAIAVLESPKITDGEVENFALQKNVLESVLRAIPMKRRFAKNYKIVRNLVCNPRTPIDLSLGLMKNLLIRDLKNLSENKEVADTIRKVALRMYKQKLEKKG